MNRILMIGLRHWKPLLGLNALVFSATAAVILSTPSVWTAKADLSMPKTTSDLKANLGSLGVLNNSEVVFSPQLNPLKTLSSILTSNATLEPVWKKDPEKKLYPRLNTYKALFKVSPKSETTVISLSADGSSPELARERLTNHIEAFQKRLDELRKDDASRRSKPFQQDLDEARRKLSQVQKELTEFQKSSNLVNSNVQTEQLIAALKDLTKQRGEILAQAQASKTQVETLSTRLRMTPEQGIRSLNLGENPDYQYVRQKLSEVEANLVKTRARFTETHPSVKSLLAQRDELRRQLNQYINQVAAGTVGVNTSIGGNSSPLIQQQVLAESQTRGLQQQANQLQSQINELKATLESIPAKQARLQELQRQYDIAEGVYKGLFAQMQEARLSILSSYPSVQILDQPSVDNLPSGPKRKLIIIGALMASASGSLALALFLESRNPLLNLKNLPVAEIPMLGIITRFKHSTEERELPAETILDFQRLASAISMVRLENSCLLISSASYGEGKTAVTLGLAKALVTLGFRVLIVDGDFRKAELSHRLVYSQQAKLKLEQPILNSKLVPISVTPNLDLLPTMPHNDGIVEYVTDGRFENGLKILQATSNYDYVLIDSAPVELTSETILMAKVARNVLLVVRPRVSNQNPVNNSIEQLRRHNTQLLGLVINDTEPLAKSDFYKHYQAEIN